MQEFFDEFPTECGNKTRPIVDLNQDSLEVLVLTHGDAAELHQEISKFKSWTLRLDLDHLLGLVYGFELEQDEVKDEICDERNVLLTVVEDAED